MRELGGDAQLSLGGEGQEMFPGLSGLSAAGFRARLQDWSYSLLPSSRTQQDRGCSCSSAFLFCFVSFSRFEFSLLKQHIVLLSV